MLIRAGSCDITPRDGPVRLAGYASRIEPTSHVLDSIEISAVLFEAAETRCLIVSFDLLFVGPQLQDLIFDKFAGIGFDPSEIMLLASHTHFAPATDATLWRIGPADSSYVDRVATAAEMLVRQIVGQAPRSVRMEVLCGRLAHSTNRRRYWPFPTASKTYGLRLGSVVMAPNAKAPTDERVTILLLRDVNDGAVPAALWHYTCHPTAVTPHNAVSPDYPGTVRRALRSRFGEIPLVFIQGFCGDIRPNLRASGKQGLWKRIKRVAKTLLVGPEFETPTSDEWARWGGDLAETVLAIAEGPISKVVAPERLAVGWSTNPLEDFFTGTLTDKPLTVQVFQIGGTVELVALSAEVNVEWNAILDKAIPVGAGITRLYAGYLGATFGYLPTASQVPEGGYEVEGFQPLFGLAGVFDDDRIEPVVVGCVRTAFHGCAVTGSTRIGD